MFVLLILCLLAGCLILLPLLLLALVVRLAIGVALIPLRSAAFVVKGAFVLVAALAAVAFAGVLLLIPLLPFAMLAFAIWLVYRMTRRQPTATLVTD